MGVRTRIFERDLIVVSSAQQARRPTHEALCISIVDHAVGIGVDEEVGVACRVVDDGRLQRFGGVGPDGLIQHLLQRLNLAQDALFHAAIAVVVDCWCQGADFGEVLGRFDAGMTTATSFHLNFQGMGVVAVDAGAVGFDMIEQRVIGLAVILIATHCQRPVLGCRCGIVVDVDET